ncbi:MAG: hypothetical protein ACREN3_02585 [Gemmatimonadaceae bacterium]
MPPWADEANIGTVAVLTLDYGEHLTAEVRGFNKDRSEVIVDAFFSDRTPRTSLTRRAIPVRRVTSFEPRLRADLPWPYSDPCRSRSFSGDRHALMATLFLGLLAGGVALSLLTDASYKLTIASAVVYTLFVVFITFGHVGSLAGDVSLYLFTCPAVRPQRPRLLRRHAAFLIALVALEALALTVRPSLPAWWNADSSALRGSPPFTVALTALCLVLAYAEIATNRSLLSRAHREFPTG